MSVMLNLYIWEGEGGGELSDQVNVVFNFVTVGPDNNYHSELWTCLQGLKKGDLLKISLSKMVAI